MCRQAGEAVMKSWYIMLPLLLIIASMGFVACTGGEDAQEYTHNIPTGELGINEYSTDPPGQSTVLPRAYPGAPPFVPHSLAGLVITKGPTSLSRLSSRGFVLRP